MTKRIRAKHKIDRRLGQNIWGRPKSPINKRESRPGQHGERRQGKLSDYGQQLRAKQKLKGYYGNIGERQFNRVYKEARRFKGSTSEHLIGLLERRLDAIVYRAKFVPTVFAARQFVSHGHMTVNGRRVNVPCFRCRVGDLVEVKEKAKQMTLLLEAIKSAERDVPDYIEADHNKMSAKLTRVPASPTCPSPCTWSPTWWWSSTAGRALPAVCTRACSECHPGAREAIQPHLLQRHLIFAWSSVLGAVEQHQDPQESGAGLEHSDRFRLATVGKAFECRELREASSLVRLESKQRVGERLLLGRSGKHEQGAVWQRREIAHAEARSERQLDHLHLADRRPFARCKQLGDSRPDQIGGSAGVWCAQANHHSFADDGHALDIKYPVCAVQSCRMRPQSARACAAPRSAGRSSRRPWTPGLPRRRQRAPAESSTV